MSIVPSTALAMRAYSLAQQAHHGQFRRDGVTPYLTHINVVLGRAPRDPISMAVTSLHDSFEKDAAHPLHYVDLEVAGMPDEVIRGVYTLTRQDTETYAAYIERVKATDGGRYVPIKVADLLSNLADNPTPGQIRRYAAALLVLVDKD